MRAPGPPWSPPSPAPWRAPHPRARPKSRPSPASSPSGFAYIAIPRPREVQTKDLRSTPPPCLRRLEDNLAWDLGRAPYLGAEMLSVSVARLGFDYGGHRLEPDLDEKTTAPVVKDGDGLLRIHRDRGAATRG